MSGNFPAFPVSTGDPDGVYQDGPNTGQFPGMTMRDYFAAKAIQSALTGARLPALAEKDQAVVKLVDEMARAMYVIADAMLKARDA